MTTRPSANSSLARWAPLAVVTAAILLGLPTLRGGFVGGDDRQLVLNHVLVNHPSLTHAARLFTIFHRDLYQPIPLVSFSLEFYLAGLLGLLHDIDAAAWLFHLTNILLHALNAFLVWRVVMTWHPLIAGTRMGDREESPSPPASAAGNAAVVAFIAGMIYAVHPLQVEAVAWLNGRMMLMSTMFFLLTCLGLHKCLRAPSTWMLPTILAAAACGMSKVRVGLPFVLTLLVLASAWIGQAGERSDGSRWRWPWCSRQAIVGLLAACFVITAVLVFVNIRATAEAGFFMGAEDKFEGPRAARVALSLAWYVRHYLLPTGLAAWYPVASVVSWTDGDVIAAFLVVAVAVAAVLLACRSTRAAAVGGLWFLLTLASTLPIIPTRSTLAADRYMYLPIVGLAWLTAACLALLGSRTRRRLVAPAGVLWLAMSLAIGWNLAATFNTYLAKAMRVAELFPDVPRVWERVAWSYYSQGDYEQAIENARKELVHDDPVLRSNAHSLVGLSMLAMGRQEDGIREMRQAVEIAPDNLYVRNRLAGALDDIGQRDEAIALWTDIVEQVPAFSPAVNRLAAALAARGDAENARRYYQLALENNSYDVQATLGLAELDIAERTQPSLARAESRLRALLAWMPENSVARTNLGVVLAATGRPREALTAYDQALRVDPHNLTAALNLAKLIGDGQNPRADEALRLATDRALNVAEGRVIQDTCEELDRPELAARMWTRLQASAPAGSAGRGEAGAWRAWSLGLAGQTDAAMEALSKPGVADDRLGMATSLLCALRNDDAGAITDLTEKLAGATGPGADRLRARVLAALERLDRRHGPGGWTYCIVTRLLLSHDNQAAAAVSIDFCRKWCKAPECAAYAAELQARIDAADP